MYIKERGVVSGTYVNENKMKFSKNSSNFWPFFFMKLISYLFDISAINMHSCMLSFGYIVRNNRSGDKI